MTKASEKKEENVTKEVKKETKKKVEQFIYCGPTIGLKVTKNTVYIGGMPKVIDKEIKECEQIKKLFVPIAKYIETKEKISEEGTVENLSYRTVESYLKKGV